MTAVAAGAPAPTSTDDEVTTPVRASGLRRVGAALAMILGPWGFVVVNTAYLIALRGGGDESTPARTLEFFESNADLVRIGSVTGMLACLLIVPAVMGALRLAPTSRLALIGGSLMVAGYSCYLAVLNSNFQVLAMAEHGEPVAAFAAVIEASQQQLWTVWVFLLFVVGNLLGTLLFAIGLVRSPGVPRLAALAIMTWPPLHVIGLVFFGNEVPQVIGAVLQAVGFGALAVALLRRRPR